MLRCNERMWIGKVFVCLSEDFSSFFRFKDLFKGEVGVCLWFGFEKF